MKSLIKKMVLLTMVAVGFMVNSTFAQHDHGSHEHGMRGHETALPNCPVMDEPINLAISIPTDNGPVFFCCKDCISKYQANPRKYATKVAMQRKMLAGREKIQVTCPVSNEPVDQDVFIESNGKKVYLCCKGCVNKYNRNPGKYAAALANSYTYQTKCPVMDEEIDPKAFTTAANGQNIYFCCKGCDKKFFANPAKYAPKLMAQGYTVKAAEMKHGDMNQKGDNHDHGSHGHGG